MKLKGIIRELKEMGTSQNIRIYKKHGAGENLYGVSLINLNILKNKIKQNHILAFELWQTQNIDAQTLATMIALPNKFSPIQLEEWLMGINYYMLIDLYVANIVSKTKFAQIKMEKWIDSKDEWVSRAGWQLLTHLAMGNYGLPNIYFTPFLRLIPSEIHKAPNRTRDAMNSALIAIGLRNNILEKKALSVAGKMGEIQFSYSGTYAKAPSATEYIKRVKRGRHRAGIN